ncbi:MAG: DUF167 domain-containing protein [Candidatus Woesearchaeota archaeon]|nr:DUF167 domain-containing protein [Candidatus Woesearchaeota archaeon]
MKFQDQEIPKPKDNLLKIIIKPNSPNNEIKGIDKVRNALKVNIAAPPEKGKANKEIIKFFSKLLKRKVTIVSGLKSKEKLLKIK